jgi:3-oxoacyl-[acyl-carrier protein] reductase
MSLARLYSGKGITSNSISPGIIETEMTSWIKNEDKQILTQDIPVGRFGLVEEVAEVVSFLASDASGYITGQTINVNGGMLRT